MSKLDELIAKYCPDGVEYKELKEVVEYARDRIDAGEIDENTYVGVDNLLPNKQGKITWVRSSQQTFQRYDRKIWQGVQS